MVRSSEDTTRQTYSVPGAARVLGISREAAYQAVARNELPSVRIGKRILIPRMALERLLAGTQGEQDRPRPEAP